MESTMQVILLQDIQGHGFQGDLVEVSDGYAQHFLFPQALAIEATPAVLVAHEKQERAREEKTKKKTDISPTVGRKRAEKLEGVECVYTASTQGDSLILAEAISVKEILSCIKKEAGIALKQEDLLNYTPITEVGSYAITLNVGGGFEAEIQLTVEGKKGE